jgi:Domain of unknown function (DUF1911)/Domain of unknown function (DUF1910)
MSRGSGSIREPYLDVASFTSMLAFRTEEAIPNTLKALTVGDIDPGDVGHVTRRLFNYQFEVALLKYSGGKPLGEVGVALAPAITTFDELLNDSDAALTFVDLSIQDHFVEALWLLSLTKLLGRGDAQVERVANLYAADETNDGADELFELILAKLGRKSFKAEGVIHADPYQLLLDCVKGEPEERPALMTQFLKRWYKGQKECDWWGSHVRRPGTTVLDTGFFGYWAFEAALVTFLWDIDDSSYRDLPHYPKDLADHARQMTLGGGGANFPARVMGGQKCPRTGFWFTPARLDSRRHFEQRQPMPEVGGDYGATIWQWDEQQ